MTHKFRKPGANVIVDSSAEQGQSRQSEESLMVQVMDRARSAIDAIQQNITEHYGVWAGIGLVSAAAIYLLATEHGRDVRSQVQETIGKSIDTAKENLTDRFNQLKDATRDVVNKAISQEDVSEDRDRPRMRRVS